MHASAVHKINKRLSFPSFLYRSIAYLSTTPHTVSITAQKINMPRMASDSPKANVVM